MHAGNGFGTLLGSPNGIGTPHMPSSYSTSNLKLAEGSVRPGGGGAAAAASGDLMGRVMAELARLRQELEDIK